MEEFALLAPGMDRRETRLLSIMLERAGLESPRVMESWREVDARYVLSVGKAAVDLWHEFGLIQVGAHHGYLFDHRASNGKSYDIMVVQHPGTLMQMSLVGHQAKDDMTSDLRAWSRVLEGVIAPSQLAMPNCAVCLRGKDKRRRTAEFWEPRLDGVGLCDDHWRKRAQISRRPKKRIEKSSREAQIKGQGEMVPDGRHVMVAKS